MIATEDKAATKYAGMEEKLVEQNLQELFEEAETYKLSRRDKYVIFSDLHVGNRRDRDDFRRNSALFLNIIEHYYLPQDYNLVLNGDVEELHKFTLPRVKASYQDLYGLFRQFDNEQRLFKLVGNHDHELILRKNSEFRGLMRAMKLDYYGDTIFIYHGHQASNFYEKHHNLSGFVLRYIAKPLRIRSRSTAYDSKKKFAIEKRVYEYSSSRKIISIIGHTHRPLFESLSKSDFLKFKMEHLIRKYPTSNKRNKRRIEMEIHNIKADLQRLPKNNPRRKKRVSLYNNTDIIVPCLFNSGTVIGKRGVTALEIKDQCISLVHWFDQRKRRKKLKLDHHPPERLGDTEYYKMILKQDQLDYIFTRIKLLA